MMTTADGSVCTGGIDSEGTFWCGGAVEQTDVSEYTLSKGWIATANGQPTTASMTAELTLKISTNGVVSDCDIRVGARLRFEGL
jgi:hypothetical protein